jgi:hypothetical protein
VADFARVFKAQPRIEECLQRAKGEAGLADYQVRTWEGWHHHQTLSLLATWFLTQETRRGKNPDAGADGPAGARMIAGLLNRAVGCHRPARLRRTMNRRLKRNEEARLYHWRRRNRLSPRRFNQRS